MADFTNIDGVYAKDTELRSGIDTLRTTVLSNTIKPLTVTKNGTYTAIPSSGTYGYSPITVDVQEEPWEPLEDGYSNFWFELTNDTLSPWLNFSAKNADATIDWGDGSGEQALTTLTPTHTYSKPGRYVVKVKGVTGIAQQFFIPLDSTNYMYCLKYAELSNEVTTFTQYAFRFCVALQKITYSDAITNFSNSTFSGCSSLRTSLTLPESLTVISNSLFYYCFGLQEITIKSNIATIEGYVFGYCTNLKAIHIQATTPPTLGNYVFMSMPNNYIIYVPVGYGDTYKAASGWSTYADHIVEEGQSLSMAALRRIQAEKNDNGEEMR